jgi:uncharacterized membrane protein YjgN (DUF898 family)
MSVEMDLQPPPASLSDVAEKAVFTGQDGEFRWLVTKGALLELLTAGFYRFWLATHVRRHLWGCTFLGGDPLEYLGTGRELLFGFFFALAILAPVYLAYFLLGLEAERYKAFASLPLALFLGVFGQFAIYRARRYRLHRTAWRGLRFGMTGSGWRYAALAFKWSFAVFFSLGLALPFSAAALERYKMENTYYGGLQGGFVGRGAELLRRGWGLWLAGLVLAGLVAAVGASQAGLPEHKGRPLFFMSIFAAEIVAIFLYAIYKAIQWRWWLEGVRIGEVHATSSLGWGALIANYWKFIGLMLLVALLAGVLLALGGAAAQMAGLHLLPARVGAAPPPGFIVGIVLWYLGTLLVIGVLWRIYFIQRVWKIVVNSLTLHALDTAREAPAREGTANALGEGFADSLDIVGF